MIAHVHLEGIDSPIGFRKCFRVVLYVILATSGKCGASAVLTPDIASPFTAKSGGEDDVVVLEILVDVAVVSSNEAGCCSSPGGGAGVGS